MYTEAPSSACCHSLKNPVDLQRGVRGEGRRMRTKAPARGRSLIFLVSIVDEGSAQRHHETRGEIVLADTGTSFY